ncbi:hypothetical protein ES703_117478 [subsurface metagenome]
MRFLGFTGLGETSALHQVVDSGRFDLVQVYYNLLNPSAGLAMSSRFVGRDFRQLLNLAAAHDMGVVVIRVLAGGALGGEYGADRICCACRWRPYGSWQRL